MQSLDTPAISTDTVVALRPRLEWIAPAWLVASSPVLAFPELFGSQARWLAAGVAIASLVLAVALLSRVPRAGYAAALLAVAVAIGWGRAESEATALRHFCGVAAGMLAMATLAAWSRNENRFALAGAAFMAMGFVAVTVGFRSMAIPGPTKYLPQLTGLLPQVSTPLPNVEAGGFVNPNPLGATALMVLPVALAFALCRRTAVPWQQATRVLAIVTSLAAAAVVVISQSRSVWLATWLMALVALARWRRLGRWRLAIVGATIVASVVFSLWFTGRLDPTIIGAADRISGRIGVWSEGVKAVAGSPLFGVGLNEFRHLFQATAPGSGKGDIAHAHNIFIQTALDTGLVGLAAYLALLALLLLRANQVARGGPGLPAYVAAGAGLSLIGVHLFGVADAVALGAKVGMFQWLAAGLILAASQVQSATKNSIGPDRFR